MSDLLKKRNDSLICSFLVSDLSNSLMIAHFLWATRANRSWLLIFSERPERFAYIAHFWWATWAIHSHRSLKKREWANRSFFFKCTKKVPKIRFSTLSQHFLSEWLTVAHLSWVTWANRLQSLIWFEWSERILSPNYYYLKSFNQLLRFLHFIPWKDKCKT